MKVLVTGAGSLCGQGIIRCLVQHNELVDIIAVDPSPEAIGCAWAEWAYTVPWVAQEKKYIEVMSAIIRRELPDILIPGTDVELLLHAKQCIGTKTLVSSPEVVNICDDKWLTYQWLRENGFNPPHTCLIKDFNKEMTFPFIAKPRIGGRSRGVRQIDWWGHMDELIKTVDPSADTYIAQELIVGPEYTAGAVVFPDQDIATIVMQRRLTDGNTTRAWVMERCGLNDFVEEVALKLQPYGPCNFQFRVQDREPRIFEINARFSGTTTFRTLAGFPEVSMCLDHIFHGTPIRQPQIRPITIARHYVETEIRGDICETANREAEVSGAGN